MRCRRQRLFVSTPNLNFLITCQRNAVFRQSVIDSDLCLADGSVLVWMSRWLASPLPERSPAPGFLEFCSNPCPGCHQCGCILFWRASWRCCGCRTAGQRGFRWRALRGVCRSWFWLAGGNEFSRTAGRHQCQWCGFPDRGAGCGKRAGMDPAQCCGFAGAGHQVTRGQW